MEKELKFYSKGEEIFNGVSHMVGGALGILFMIILVIFGVVNDIDTLGIFSCVIFGVSMILLYTMSSLYHMITHKTAKKVLRIFDHCTIFILIAGTYTPYILLRMREFSGYFILAFVWVLAILGIVLNAINMHNKYVKIYSYIAYVLMGWCIIFIFPLLFSALETSEFIFLLLGGIFYTVGLIFYFGGRKFKWWHSVWHLFDLFGTIFQFISLLLIVN